MDGRDAEVKVEEENRSLKADLQRLKDELAVNKQSEHCRRVARGPQSSGATASGCHTSLAKVLITSSHAGSGAA